MKRHRSPIVGAVMLLIGVTNYIEAGAQQIALSGSNVAAPIETEPYSLGVSSPNAPIQMRAEDMESLLQQLNAQPASASKQSSASSLGGSVSRTITVPAPRVVNVSSHFQYRDITEGSVYSAHTKLPLADRQSTVEAYRRSLVKGAGTSP